MWQQSTLEKFEGKIKFVRSGQRDTTTSQQNGWSVRDSRKLSCYYSKLHGVLTAECPM